jgi:hypothetical protein
MIVPLVVVSFTWLSVPGVAEWIGPAEGAVGPAAWLTG